MPGFLPADPEAVLLGRLWLDDGPTPVGVIKERLYDLSGVAPTVSDLLARLPEGEALPLGRDLGPVHDYDFSPQWERAGGVRLLAPIDLQCIKAVGVTFAVSALERVIEERARGDAARAAQIRAEIGESLGSDLRVKPGSDAALKLKEILIQRDYWSQYLEVAIGPHAEVFTKAPVLSAVGWGDDIGIRGDSEWNNPEPEVVLVCDPAGRIRGATLGNDVNLRDIEGRSALLLGKAKDNNASCALGPFIRLFDPSYGLDDLRRAEVTLEIVGQDNFRLEGSSNMALISRDPLELVAQTYGANHRYPDGFVLMLGTMFAPIEDRDVAGGGFTHKRGDIVRVASKTLGVLENRVLQCDDTPPWEFGVSALMRNLASRGLLDGHS